MAKTSNYALVWAVMLMTSLVLADQRPQRNHQNSIYPTERNPDQLHQQVAAPSADRYVDGDSSSEDIDVDRRSFDRISGMSSLGGLQKREFDSQDSLGGLQKRRFDRIAFGSSLGGFNKRQQQYELDNEFNNAAVDEESAKRSFDRISSFSSLGGLQNKRMFDRIAGISSLGGLHKKSFDRIAGVSSLGGLVKRPFDKIGGMSSLGGFVGGMQKRRNAAYEPEHSSNGD